MTDVRERRPSSLGRLVGLVFHDTPKRGSLPGASTVYAKNMERPQMQPYHPSFINCKSHRHADTSMSIVQETQVPGWGGVPLRVIQPNSTKSIPCKMVSSIRDEKTSSRSHLVFKGSRAVASGKSKEEHLFVGDQIPLYDGSADSYNSRQSQPIGSLKEILTCPTSDSRNKGPNSTPPRQYFISKKEQSIRRVRFDMTERSSTSPSAALRMETLHPPDAVDTAPRSTLSPSELTQLSEYTPSLQPHRSALRVQAQATKPTSSQLSDAFMKCLWFLYDLKAWGFVFFTQTENQRSLNRLVLAGLGCMIISLVAFITVVWV